MFNLLLKLYGNPLLKSLLQPFKQTFLFEFFRVFILKGLTKENNLKTEIIKIKDFIQLVRPVQTQFNLIRIGGDNDGGYLIPDDLSGVRYLFSPGVGNQISFDLALAKRGIQCFLADGSIDRLPAEHHLISFEKVYIDIKNTDNSITLDCWINTRTPNEENLILQMDIEGAEYRILQNLSIYNLSKFRIMVIEFHGLERLFYKRGFDYITAVFKKITKLFDIVHIHPNNSEPLIISRGIKIPPVMEFTFLRKDRVMSKKFATKFPNHLDQKNDPDRRDILLPETFYK
jgi:hypothetical protein